MTYNSRGTSLVVCTDLSEKEPQRQVGMGKGMKSVSVSGVMVITLARTGSYVGSLPVLGDVFHTFTSPITRVALTRIQYKLCLLSTS